MKNLSLSSANVPVYYRFQVKSGDQQETLWSGVLGFLPRELDEYICRIKAQFALEGYADATVETQPA